MENKCETNENKLIIRNFIFTMNKMDMDGGNKPQRLHRCGSNMPCQNVSSIMSSRTYREGRTQIPVISPITIDLLAQDPGQTFTILT